MNAKLLYSCAVLLFLHLVGADARASTVDRTAVGIVAFDEAAECALTSSGQVFGWVSHDVAPGWRRPTGFHDPSLPVSQLAFWTVHFFVTTNGDAYVLFSGDDAWHNIGPVPLGNVQTQATSWSKAKAAFRK